MFAAEFEPAEATGRRRNQRAPASLDVRLGDDAFSRTLCRIVDLSVDGARMKTHSTLRAGNMIWLTLPLVGTVAAEIIWADDFSAGCRFQKPLQQKILEQLRALED